MHAPGHSTAHSLFWVKHLKLADSLDVRDIAKRLNLFQVQVTGAGRFPSTRGTTANLADVGFGVSQVLPVLVQGLLMRPGGVYLVQQPEIHLHPDAQAGLADFFIYLASYGIITIVETHSEYLLLRIRRRLAEGAPPISMGLPTERPQIQTLRPNDVSVLFTGFEDKRAAVKQLHIGTAFQFENLPSGFMSQALDDRLALLKAVTKKNALPCCRRDGGLHGKRRSRRQTARKYPRSEADSDPADWVGGSALAIQPKASSRISASGSGTAQ